MPEPSALAVKLAAAALDHVLNNKNWRDESTFARVLSDNGLREVETDKGVLFVMIQNQLKRIATLKREAETARLLLDERGRDEAQPLCQIYFDIAVGCIGEVEVRRRRDAAIERVARKVGE